jgi:CheY-like chemotaxis protein
MSAARSEGRTPASPEDDSPLRVLIVEDSAMVAESLQLALRACGMVVCCAHSGKDGVEAAVRFHPDVVLIDLGLPDFDGHAAARMIAQSGLSPLPMLVALSGRPGAAGPPFAHSLTKPVRLETLLSVLQLRDAKCIPRS